LASPFLFRKMLALWVRRNYLEVAVQYVVGVESP
jgi:hypothetical protein